MNPIYASEFSKDPGLVRLTTEVPWLRESDTRSECFMAATPYSYTYGRHRGIRTYQSVPFTAGVDTIMVKLNTWFQENNHSDWSVNGCFLNMYLNEHDHLGWHADDFNGMDQTQPVVSISFGAEREIWWRPMGTNGVIPSDQKQLLAEGSLFIMPPGFQDKYQHRIPKGDRPLGVRVSLTFRSFLDMK